MLSGSSCGTPSPAARRRAVTSSGTSAILFITSLSCLIRSPALALQLSKWDVMRQNFWPLNSTWF
ncbi:hypothetical protein EYF80_016107 [Liparis tanakae]|uniref:Uncharacterized protein n=1 Tax=Liparis tanakae TaxID=230148 RepID=A0A4Z2I6R7_9TELE|nr:hypothetical protein EYF80_016107 [Liparis tanakae]